MFQPSGKMEDFFRALGALKTQPTPEEGAKIFAAHDMQVVGHHFNFNFMLKNNRNPEFRT
jgi:hypothetical protein